jgi:hypothetical protein
VQEVRQWLTDSPETSIYTCFSLCYKGKRLDDYKELQEEGITQDCELDLIEGSIFKQFILNVLNLCKIINN